MLGYNSMSETMKISDIAQCGQQVDLSSLCQMAWTSAERMSWALADIGLDYSISSCKRVRSGRGDPSYSMGYAIAALAEAKIEHDIETRRERLRKLRKRRHD
jgi:hypothetical protein